MKQIDRLLYSQGGECFFCKRQLSKAEASVEHLVASANGGGNAEDNCVACCKTLNALLGSKPLKEKIEVFLKQRGAFRCPAELNSSAPPPLAAKAVSVAPVFGTAGRPKPAKMRKPIFTLAPLPKPVVQPSLGPAAAAKQVTCPTCKSSVAVAVGQIDFKCQRCGPFRY